MSRLPSYQFNGRDYVKVADLAHTYGLVTLVSGKYVTLTNQHVNLRLEVDDRQARLNGVNLWLSSPPAIVRGATVISRTDVVKVIDPILFPSRDSVPTTFRAIVIDPGHGGADTGTMSSRGLLEKTAALDVSRRLQEFLARQGFVATLTRPRDQTLPLDQRVAQAKQVRADLFVSIHFNSEGRGKSARGIETYCLTPSGSASTASSRALGSYLPGNRFDDRNMLLGYAVQRNVTKATDAPDRGVRRARFYVLQYTECPAILVECGFLSNMSEANLIATASYREKIATGIGEGIVAYKRTVER